MRKSLFYPICVESRNLGGGARTFRALGRWRTLIRVAATIRDHMVAMDVDVNQLP